MADSAICTRDGAEVDSGYNVVEGSAGLEPLDRQVRWRVPVWQYVSVGLFRYVLEWVVLYIVTTHCHM